MSKASLCVCVCVKRGRLCVYKAALCANVKVVIVCIRHRCVRIRILCVVCIRRCCVKM